MIMAFIEERRGEGHAVESICRVLREQGCQIAARSFRAWRHRVPSQRAVSDAHVIEAIRRLCWRTDQHGRIQMTPEGLYGRRKLTALLRRQGLVVAECTVARCMAILGHQGVVRAKRVRTTIPGQRRHTGRGSAEP